MKKFALILFFLPLTSQARVLHLGEESIAAYFKGVYWPSATTNTLFSGSNGPETIDVAEALKATMGGEIGMVYATRGLNVRLGLEVLAPTPIKNEPGLNASAQKLFDATSEVSIVIPKLGFEFNLTKHPQSRAFLFAGVGSAQLVGRNSYVFTAQGLTDLSLTENFYEELRGSALSYEAAFGFESLLADTTTISLEAGYRSLEFKSVTHNRAVTTISQGAVAKGDLAKNADGTQRELSLSQPFLVLQFRFWLK